MISPGFSIKESKLTRLSAPPRLADNAHRGSDGKLVREGYGYRWYRVGGLDYLLKRSDIDTNAAGKASHPA